MFHCSIFAMVVRKKGFGKSDSKVLPSSASVSNDLYLLFVRISESDLGGMLSLGLDLFSFIRWFAVRCTEIICVAG